MKKKILMFAFFANILGVCSQTFTNSNQSLAGSWNGTLSKTVTVSGLPNLNASIFELVQVNLHLGDDANTRNNNTYRITLTKGTTSIDLVATGGLPNSAVKQINTKFRFNPFLKRLSEHGGVAEPFSIGYYRSQDNYTAFNGLDPNGDWTVTITETAIATGGRFNRVDLVFKSPFTVQDYTTVTSYDNCATPYCLGTAEIIVASNNGFTSQVEDMYNPNTIGCSWNATQNNSAFFKFRAAQTSASVTISGISGNLQILAIDAGLDDNPCTAADNIVLNGGCPTLSSNDTYTSPQYINGSTKNNQLNLSGLTIGKTYYFIVDGTGSSVSPFYIETIGTSLDCSNCDLNATLSSNSPVCENSSLNLTCSDGTNWSWTGPNGFTSSSQNPTLSNVSTLASGIYTVVITDGNGCTETKSITVSVTTVVTPTFNASNPVCTGATLSPLPTISNNAISGTWSPALNTTTTTNYTFTPNVGQCATTATRTIVVNNCDFDGYATAVWMDDCTTPGDGKFYNTTGGGADLINQEAGNTFIKDFGVHVQNSSTLILRGSEVKTYKNGNTNVCGATMYYRFYLTNGTAGTFTSRNLSFFSNCNTAISEFFIGGGPCADGQQKWQCVSQPGCDTPINLTTVPPGDYTLEVYYDVRGDFNSTSQCDDTIIINNGGTNYKANFSIISTPIISNTNPSTCNGTDGSITISGLAANEVYALTYDFNTTPVGSANFTSNISGQITIPNLGIGTYTNFNFVINSCSTTLPSGVTLQNPIFTPVFSTPNPFCNGEAIPSSTLPTFSNNGISGNWTPALNNTATTTYTFTPDAGQCAINANLTVFINPEITGGITTTPNTACITLPATACNGSATINVTQGSGNYSYLWNDLLAQTTATATNLCAGSYCVTVTDLDTNCTQQFCTTVSDNIPNVTPTFSFGTSANICSGSSVPSLPLISDNSISGSWLPPLVDNANNGLYTFNPMAGQCATTATFSVSVAPQTTPTFSFGTSTNICSGGIVPALPAISTNGVSGTWNPPIVDNTINAVYTFTPSSSGSSSPNLIVNGDFSQGNTNFSTDYQFLPNAGVNGVQRAYGIVSAANAWFQFFQPCVSNAPSGGNMMVVDGSTSNSGNDKVWGQTVAVLPNKTYTFSYWLQTIATPNQALIEVEINGTIIGSAIAPNTNCTTAQYSFQWNSGSNTTAQIGIFDRIFVANGNDFSLDDISLVENVTQCASIAIFTVTVTPQTTPTFSFGSVSTICSGNTVPALPSSSENSISGFWLPPVVDNTNNGTYTFQPNAGQCATSASYVVTITPQTTPIFSFGTSSSICSGDLVTALPNTSSNSIVGAWSPTSVSNTNSGTYTFIPNTNQCATTTTFTVNVTPQTTPTFSFGTNTTICSGSSTLELPLISANSVEGLWSPSTIDSINSVIYSFAPNTGQCATSTSLAVTVNPIPQFTITGGCDGDDYRLEIVEQNQNITNVSWLYNNAEIGQGNSIVITEEGVFTAVTTNSNGCQNSQEIDIVNSFCKIPKGVSANNDGDNDFFELSNLNVKKLQIFNRYGMVVYTKNNYTNEWNGQSDNGNEVPDGTYYYVVEQNSGKVRVGWVHLIREN